MTYYDDHPDRRANSLAAFCEKQNTAAFVTVDTEFVLLKTYYPILCLVQVAGPDDAVVIDAMAPTSTSHSTSCLRTRMSSSPSREPAGCEIFFNLFGSVPIHDFDTQIAAMVCGFGDQVAYGTLIAELVGVQLEKTSRFADWSRRPLTQKQLAYALSDVTHLRVAYEKLAVELETSGRAHWLNSEMDVLTDPDTYRMDPREAWRRIKSRTTNPKFLSVLREVAAWREAEAQRRDIP